MAIWLTTDWHLFHKPKGFSEYVKTRNYNRLMEKIHHTVLEDDILLVLGDLSHRENEQVDLMLFGDDIRNLPGYHILVKGNHDILPDNQYYALGFDRVCTCGTYDNLIFTHKPVPVGDDEVNIHGHVHNELFVSIDSRHIHIPPVEDSEDPPLLRLDDVLRLAATEKDDFITASNELSPDKLACHKLSTSKDHLQNVCDFHEIFDKDPAELAGPIEVYESLDESSDKIEWKNDKGKEVPKICPKCGSKVCIFLRGEPVFLCSNKKCKKYFGTVPFSNESTVSLPEKRQLAKERNVPIFVCLFHFSSVLSTVIAAITKDEYTHSAISFDTSLTDMYSFGKFYPNNPIIGKFVHESLFGPTYSQVTKHAIYVVFVTPEEKEIIKARLEWFIANKGRMRYNYEGLVKSLFHVAEEDGVTKYAYLCSEFVASILKSTGRNFIETPSNLVKPNDFPQYPWCYYLGSGLKRAYDRTAVDRRLSEIIEARNHGDEMYLETASEIMDESSFRSNNILSERVFFISQSQGLKTLQPRVPDNFLTKNGYEDASTPRACFSTSIDGCLRGLAMNLKGEEFFVYSPDGNYEIISPSVQQVPDVRLTHEKWILTPVKLKCIGRIRVIKDAGGPGLKYQYGDHTAELCDWEWEYVEQYRLNEAFGISPPVTNNGFYGKHGGWNSLIVKNGKRYRQRVETLIVRDGHVLIQSKSDGTYRLPGGSTEKDLTAEQAAVKECQEEARIIPINMQYFGEYIEYTKPKEWELREFTKDQQYDGRVCYIFVGTYLAPYTKPVDKYDFDVFYKYAKWIPIDTALTMLRLEHVNALIAYRKMFLSESIQYFNDPVWKSHPIKIMRNRPKWIESSDVELCIDKANDYIEKYRQESKKNKLSVPKQLFKINPKPTEILDTLIINKLMPGGAIIKDAVDLSTANFFMEITDAFRLLFITHGISIDPTKSSVDVYLLDGYPGSFFKKLHSWKVDISIFKRVKTNVLGESAMKSTFDSDYEQNGKRSLNSFKRISLTEPIRKKYAERYPGLRHFVATDDHNTALIWVDRKDDIAAMLYVATFDNDSDHRTWIEALEVTPEYRGYGLSKQLLDYATKTLHADALGVAKDNEIATQIYLKYGFKFGKDVGKQDEAGKVNRLMYLGEDATRRTSLDDVPKLYHGSNKKLTVLNPSISTHGQPYVYATSDPNFAVCYAGKPWSDFEINQCYYNGQLVLTEMQPGVFKDKFRVRGYLYELSPEDFKPLNRREFVCAHPVTPIRVDDFGVWEEISGRGIKQYGYPNLPPFIKNRAEYFKDRAKILYQITQDPNVFEEAKHVAQNCGFDITF